MAQLSDDCFAFGGPMMSVDEAVGIIAARVSAVHEVESVSLNHADGRSLAHDIQAPLPQGALCKHPCRLNGPALQLGFDVGFLQLPATRL